MEYKRIDELSGIADVHAGRARTLSRSERLDRWAELLERDASRRLRSLGEIELKSPAERLLMRAPDSPLTVAYEDPVLRAEGLASDRLGDAIEFFELTNGQAHRLLCSCMNGWSMLAGTTARRVRRIAHPDPRLRAAAWAGAGTLALAAPALLYLFG